MSKEDEKMAKRERGLGSVGVGPYVGEVEEVEGANLEGPVLKDPKATIKSDLLAPQPKGKPEDRLRRALKNMLDNTAPDATPRPVRQEAEAAVKG